MAQHRAVSDSKDSTEEAASFGEVLVADCVDAAVDRVQSAHTHAVLDRAAVDAEVVQLSQRDNAMLGRSEGRQSPIGRGCSTFG